MVTAFEFEDMALSRNNSNVVPPKFTGARMSLKKQLEKGDIQKKMVDSNLKGNFVQKFVQLPIDLPPKQRPETFGWDTPTAEFPAEPDMVEPKALIADGTNAPLLEQKSKSEISASGPPPFSMYVHCG
ncbi:hypothetical protein AVEN_15035-1 [Araneus ventricosus]|uniref:Uncharacterized protein n=1 Tax=Araneus ventricosus TaxID=182803 RepID=A0A4Y2NJF3_ARAVE|nr:hypothetical protein AVEN_15035-1 [Araneus ventricosus]